MSEKIISLGGRHTPLEVQRKIPWEKLSKVIVIYETIDGDEELHVSEMEWKDRAWLTNQLVLINTLERLQE